MLFPLTIFVVHQIKSLSTFIIPTFSQQNSDCLYVDYTTRDTRLPQTVHDTHVETLSPFSGVFKNCWKAPHTMWEASTLIPAPVLGHLLFCSST